MRTLLFYCPRAWYNMYMAVEKEKETTFLARTNFRGTDRIFGIKAKDRRQHMYVIGKTGTGKQDRGSFRPCNQAGICGSATAHCGP